MKHFKIIKILALISFLIISNNSFAQDSSKIIILNEEIGTVVDREEKIEYGILPIFNENFVNAVFYQTPDSQYCCKVKLKENNILRDTILVLSYNSIKNIAYKVQLKNYKMTGSGNNYPNEAVLKFANKEEVKKKFQSETETTIKFGDINKHLKILSSKKILPIKRLDLDYSELLRDPLKFGLAIGFRYNNSKYRELRRIFNLIEENIPENEYEVTKSDFKLTTPIIFNISSLLTIEQKYLFELEYAFNVTKNYGSTLRYSSFDVSSGYLFNFHRRIIPYAMLSYSIKEIKAKNEYDEQINDNGGILETITLVGNLGGVKFSLGIKFSMSNSTLIDIRGSYAIFPKADIINSYNYSLPAHPKVNMDGFEFGMKLNFY